MGYSCTAIADLVLEAIMKQVENVFHNGKKMQNTWIYKEKQFFTERGKENFDGAITGSLWYIYPKGHLWEDKCQRRGNFRIEANGIIHSFPYIPLEVKRKAVIKANEKYQNLFVK